MVRFMKCSVGLKPFTAAPTSTRPSTFLGMGQGEVHRDAAAGRRADQGGVLQPGRLHHRVEVGDGVVGRGGGGRSPIAPAVIAHDPALAHSSGQASSKAEPSRMPSWSRTIALGPAPQVS
jgi:hypothetical protein